MYRIKYFGDHTNLHGVRYVISRKILKVFKQLFWASVLASCCFGAAEMLKAVLSLYWEGTVSYTVDTNYLDWETPFPALTVCELPKDDGVNKYLIDQNMSTSFTNFYKEVSFWSSSKYCRSCVSCKVNKTCEVDYLERIKQIRLPCKAILTDCWWNDQLFSCCDRFHPISTEFGICYVFNSQLTGNSSILTVNRKLGLPSLEFTAVGPIEIRVHGPNDIVSAALENVLGMRSTLPLISNFDAVFQAEETVNDISVESSPISSRGCMFAKAGIDSPQEYSRSSCLLKCRATAQMTLCNCTHHFITTMGTVTCDIIGLACLHKNKGNIDNVECQCPMDCNEILYKPVHVFFQRHRDNIPEDLLARGSRGKLRLLQLPALRIRRQAFRDSMGLVVDVGGVGGVFFGASLLSVIEIVYLFCIRKTS